MMPESRASNHAQSNMAPTPVLLQPTSLVNDSNSFPSLMPSNILNAAMCC